MSRLRVSGVQARGNCGGLVNGAHLRRSASAGAESELPKPEPASLRWAQGRHGGRRPGHDAESVHWGARQGPQAAQPRLGCSLAF
eukprot:1923037-Alexandrium_andersonii.AAC.1